MAKKTRKSASSQADLKAKQKILIKKGLYKPKNARGKVTDHAKKLIRQFGDIFTGKASVVTAKPAKKGNKGFKEARELAGSETKPGTIRAVRNKIIVPTQAGETARYTKSGVRVTRRVAGDLYIRRPFKTKPKTLDDILSQLKPGDYVAVPSFRGNRKGVEWFRFSQDEFKLFYFRYGEGGPANTYDSLLDYVEIASIEQNKRKVIDDEELKDLNASENPEYSPSKFSPGRKRAAKKKSTKKKSAKKSRKRKLS